MNNCLVVSLACAVAAWGCSKTNSIDASTTNNFAQAVVCQGPAVDNAMCEAAQTAPPGALCVYGVCRTPCTSDAQCEALVPGSVCLPGADGSGCRLPQEGSCATTGCNGGLICASDGTCRAPCSNECWLQGLSCAGGICTGQATGAGGGGGSPPDGAICAQGPGGFGGAPAGPCDPASLWCSIGQIPTSHKKESSAVLADVKDTGWMPTCASAPPACTEAIALGAQVDFTALSSGGPMYSVQISNGMLIDVRWDAASFHVSAAQNQGAQGILKVAHSLSIDFSLYLNTAGYNTVVAIPATTLINYSPGSQWNYTAGVTQKFDGWGFDLVTAHATGSDVQSSQLFAITLEQLGKVAGTSGFNEIVSGPFSFNATTDSAFTYKTGRVVVQDADGDIVGSSSTVNLPTSGATDAMDMTVHAEGTLGYSGTLKVLPNITVSQIGGLSAGVSYQPAAALEFPYQGSDIPIVFPNAAVHIPLPNLSVPSAKLSFGSVGVGGGSAKSLHLENTGELGAIVRLCSSSDQFFPTATSVTVEPGSSFDMSIQFRPAGAGIQSATLYVQSNDPDTPSVTVPLEGTGF